MNNKECLCGEYAVGSVTRKDPQTCLTVNYCVQCMEAVTKLLDEFNTKCKGSRGGLL